MKSPENRNGIQKNIL